MKKSQFQFYICPVNSSELLLFAQVIQNFKVNSKIRFEGARTLQSDFDFVSFCDRSIVLIPYPLLKWANDNGHVRTLAAWLLFKRQFKTGHIHKQSNIKFVSHATRVKYFNRLMQFGLIEADPNFGYRCISLRRATQQIAGFKGNYKPVILNRTTINDLIKQLRAIVLRSSLQQQRYVRLQSLDKSKARLRENSTGRQHNAATLILSDKGAGRIIRMSQATGRRLKQWLKKIGLLKLINQAPIKIRQCSGELYWKIREVIDEGYYRWEEGWILKLTPQVIEVALQFRGQTPAFDLK